MRLLLIYWTLWLVAQQAIKNDNWEKLVHDNNIYNSYFGFFFPAVFESGYFFHTTELKLSSSQFL